MNRLKLLLPLCVLLAACDKGDALIVVSLNAAPALAGITRFSVDATVGTTTRSFDVTPTTAIALPPRYDFGIRVPPSLGSSIDVTIVAHAGNTTLAQVHGGGAVKAGKRTNLDLQFGSASPDAGVGDLLGRDLIAPPGSDLLLPAGSDLLPPEGSDLMPPEGSDLMPPPSCDEATCAPCTDCGSGGTCTKLVISADDNLGQVCQSGSTCNAQGVCKIRQGFACSSASPGDCVTGNCVDGLCCDKSAAMCGQCQVCNRVGFEGTCTAAADGTDPDSECGAAYNCRGGQCAGSCYCPGSPDLGSFACNNAFDGYSGGSTPTVDCKAGYYCVGSGYTCIQKKCSGSCGRNIECAKNDCPYPALMCMGCL